MRCPHGAIGDTPPGLAVIEVAKLPDEPSQAFATFRPMPLLETRQCQPDPASQPLDPGRHVAKPIRSMSVCAAERDNRREYSSPLVENMINWEAK